MPTRPSQQAIRGTLGNLDGASAGIGSANPIVEPGTGNFLITNGASPASATPVNVVVNVAMANVGAGAGVFARPANNNTLFNFRSLVAGDGMTITVVGDSIVLSSQTNARFNQLSDVPPSYVGQDGKILVVDEANSRLVFRTSASRIISSSTPPENPNPGDSWFNDTTGSLYVYYVENSVGQWVESGT